VSIPFWKAYAEGNSYVIVDTGNAVEQVLPWIVDGRRGLGGDGVLLADWRPGPAVGMRVFNPDGSEAPSCGNGARCLAALALRTGRAHPGDAVTVECAGGSLVHRLADATRMAIVATMPLPGDPVIWRDGNVAQVEIGISHRVVFRDLDGLDPAAEGPLCARQWPGGTNVMFTQVISPGMLDVVPWERGVGPTLGCATGAAAAAIAAAGYVPGWPGRVRVRQPGGSVGVSRRAGALDLTGTVRFIAEGTVETG
jgi:diaminopimelate epimerase